MQAKMIPATDNCKSNVVLRDNIVEAMPISKAEPPIIIRALELYRKNENTKIVNPKINAIAPAMRDDVIECSIRKCLSI